MLAPDPGHDRRSGSKPAALTLMIGEAKNAPCFHETRGVAIGLSGYQAAFVLTRASAIWVNSMSVFFSS
jgi:hypothetical protein